MPPKGGYTSSVSLRLPPSPAGEGFLVVMNAKMKLAKDLMEVRIVCKSDKFS